MTSLAAAPVSVAAIATDYFDNFANRSTPSISVDVKAENTITLRLSSFAVVPLRQLVRIDCFPMFGYVHRLLA